MSLEKQNPNRSQTEKYKKEQFILWAWKGDYINLGAGAELGIYHGGGPKWKTGDEYAMPMTLTLNYNGDPIISYDPVVDDRKGKKTDKWWITGFDPSYPDVLAKELEAIYTINFSGREGMYNAFMESDDYLRNRSKWTISEDNKYRLTFTFK